MPEDQITVPGLQDLSQVASNTLAPLKQAYAKTSEFLSPYVKEAAKYKKPIGLAAASVVVPGLAASYGVPKAAGLLEPSQVQEARRTITDVERTKAENRALKNPFQATTYEGRQEAIGGKLQRLTQDSDYQKLSPEQRVKVRNSFYNRYIVPIAQQEGKKPIDRKLWLSATRQDASGKVFDVEYGITKGALGVALAGTNIGRKEWAGLFGMNNFFHGDTAWDLEASWEKGKKEAEKTIYTKAIDRMQGAMDDLNFLINSRPRDSFLSSASIWTGEQVAQLPVYEALGVGSKALAATETGVGLTGVLSQTPGGMFVANRLANAAEGYLGARATGSEHKEAVKAGVGFAVAAPLLGAVGSAWRGAAKKLTANNIVMGGENLQAEITDSAISELKGQHTISAEDIINRKVHDAEKQVLNDISQELHRKPITETVHNKEQLNAVVAERAKVTKEAAVEAPLHNSDLNKQEVTNTIKQQAAESPAFAKNLQRIKETYGDDLIEFEHQRQMEEAAKEAGRKDTTEVVQEIANTKVKPATVAATASQRLGPKPPKEQVITAEKLATNKKETIARYTDEKTTEPFRAVGASINFREMDNKTLTKYLTMADGDIVKYENPFHRWLMHWDNRRQLPDELRLRLMKALKDHIQAKYPGQPFLVRDLEKYASRAQLHIQMLSKSGRLTSQKNMFKSTNLFGAPTEWQTDLNTEIDNEEIQTLRNSLANHPESLRTLETYLKTLQANRAEGMITPRQWRDYNHAIYMLLGGEPKKAMTYGETLREAYASVPSN